MRTYIECLPCFLRQALDAARLATDDEPTQERILRQTMLLAGNMNLALTPPQMAGRIQEVVRKVTGIEDPYADKKHRSNEIAMEMYPSLKDRVRSSTDTFAVAVRLAAAGNTMDLGCRTSLTARDVDQAVDAALSAPLDTQCLEDLRAEVLKARRILYVADNAGEIVFDRVLIEEFTPGRTALAVRGSAVLDDATAADAEAAGLAGLVRVIDTGSDAPAAILKLCSPSFREEFETADVVISKGQGNYEGLSGEGEKVFFILTAKCPVVARDIGCPVGTTVVRRGRLA